MMKLSRGALAAIAAVIAIPAGVAIARNYEHGGWQRMSPETRARLDEGRLAGAKAALKLTAGQETLWAAVETEIKAGFKLRSDRMAEREKMRDEWRKSREANKDGTAPAKPDVSERFEKMTQHTTERAARMQAFTAAFKPFYASLSDEQKEVLRPLLRDLMPGGGKGHGGKRWAHGGGWGGDRGGWGHHGGGRHGGGRHEGRGGPMMDERGGGGPGSDDKGPPAQQLAPDQAGEDDGTVPADRL